MSLKAELQSKTGYFGDYGGCYVPELLLPTMQQLADAFYKYKEDSDFLAELADLYNNYSGRPTPLYYCENLSEAFGGARIYLKNEGLNHTGAHKINHCLGQALLAKKLGKKRLIAETGAGQHGLATATIAAKLGLKATIYMGLKDYKRQRPNVFWMEQLGAEVIPVEHGGQILRDAISEALRDLLADPVDSHYLLGTVCGPHPYPAMNTFFQSIVGREVKQKFSEITGKPLPDYLMACVGGGSNAMGLFFEFLDDPSVRLIGVEAGGQGITYKDGKFTHAARFQAGKMGVVEGFKSLFLQDEHGQLQETSSISAGLDYAGVGPQIAYLQSIGRLEMQYALDEEVKSAYKLLAEKEGIIAAVESLHAFVAAFKLAPTLSKDQTIVVNCSGRGDKDLFITTKAFADREFADFLASHLKTLTF